MPITLPQNLPAYSALKNEGVMVMDESVATRQDIRPLRIGLLNLMPKKIQTETQFARLIGATPLQIDLRLIRMNSHQTRTTSAQHMARFYRPFKDICDQKFDGLIITGAPIETLDYKKVSYWDELCTVFKWTQSNVHSTFGVCWGAMAMLYYFYGIDKHNLNKKIFGCYRQQKMVTSNPYLRGFSDDCVIPVSRWSEIRQKDIDTTPSLKTLLYSDKTGPCLLEDEKHRALYIFNHFEYDHSTLHEEYQRDIENAISVTPPFNYYPNDNPKAQPINRWRSHAHLLYGNWINQIYQTTPYDMSMIGLSEG